MRRYMERTAEGWFVVTELPGEVYGATSVVRKRTKVCGADIPYGNAKAAALGLGLIAKAEIEETERGNGYGV